MRSVSIAAVLTSFLAVQTQVVASSSPEEATAQPKIEQFVIMTKGSSLEDAGIVLGGGIERVVIDRNQSVVIVQGTLAAISLIAASNEGASILPAPSKSESEFLSLARSYVGADPLATAGVSVILAHKADVPQGLASHSMGLIKPTPEGTVVVESFEGALATSSGGQWSLSSSSSGYGWAATSCDAASGSRSGDPWRGGSSGSALSCSGTYPSGVETWLTLASAISVAGSTAPVVNFSVKGKTSTAKGSNGTYLDSTGFYISSDGNSGYGYYFYGDLSAGWSAVSCDMTSWYTLGDLRNASGLYVWFAALSSSGAPSGNGMRIDDFSITTGSSCHVTVAAVDTSACPNISLTVTPTDGSGQGLTGLTSANFTVQEDGVTRNATATCGSSGSGAASVVILLDESGSLGTTGYANEVAAAKSLVDLLPSGTSIAVSSFGSSVYHLIGFTTDKTAVKAALTNNSYSAGNTALYDGLVDAASLLGGRSGQRLTIMMTDGEDTASSNDESAAIAAARAKSVAVYAVGFGASLTTGSGVQILRDIASQTGGQYYYGSDSTALPAIVAKIGSAISSQCTLTFASSYTSGSHTVTIGLATSSCSTSASTTVSRSCASCTSSSTSLCLMSRFKVEADWRNYSNQTGQGTAVPMTSDTGYFWFSSASNVEVVAKAVSFCSGSSGNYGFYAGGLTDQYVKLKVTDTKTGTYREYVNNLGNPWSLTRDGPFTCP